VALRDHVWQATLRSSAVGFS